VEKSQSVVFDIQVEAHDPIKIIKQILVSMGPFFTPSDVSSVYKVQSIKEKASHVHDLRTKVHFEGAVMALRGFSKLGVIDLHAQARLVQDTFNRDSMRQKVLVSLLFYGNELTLLPDFTIPDPDFHRSPERVIPAAEVWPEYVHPVLKLSLRQLAEPYSSQNWGEFLLQGKAMLDF
jgi:hypothetical protein